MKEQLISDDTDKLLRKKGIILEQCRCGGFPDCICQNKKPTQSLLQKLLREKHQIDVYATLDLKIESGNLFSENGKYMYYIFYKKSCMINVGNFDTYEDALEEGLNKSLKL